MKDCLEVTIYWGVFTYGRHRFDFEIYPEGNSDDARVKYIEDTFSDLILVKDGDDSLFTWNGKRFIPKAFAANDYTKEALTNNYLDWPYHLTFDGDLKDRAYLRAVEDINYWYGQMRERITSVMVLPKHKELEYLSDPEKIED
jgi:hypothetical protein